MGQLLDEIASDQSNLGIKVKNTYYVQLKQFQVDEDNNENTE